MGASNSKQRSEMSHEQVFAHMIIGFNGPSTSESIYSPKQLQLIEIL
jgi:hypothetical protein